MDMSGFSCTGCGHGIDIGGLDPSYAERKVFCVRCGHVTTI
jgi:hypothetical protein